MPVESFSNGGIFCLIVFFTVFLIAREVLTFRNRIFFKYLLTPMVTLSVILISFTAIPDSSEPVFSSLIFWGLLLSLVADVLLMIVEVRMLLHGLVFFLLAHVLYISAFATRYEFSATHLAFVPVIAAPMALFFMKIRGKAGKMAAPVLVYMSVISTMVFLAVAGAFDGSAGLRGYIGAAGAVLFLVSDAILAFNEFYREIPHSTVWVWAVYAPAQMLLALSCK